MEHVASGFWVAYALLGLVLPIALRWRRMRFETVRIRSARFGSVQWTSERLAAVAVGAAVVATFTTETFPPLDALDRVAAHLAGIALLVLGGALVVWGQAAMGASWRIGQDATEQTELVASGPFAHVRNPIFSGMFLALAGSALLVPSALSLTAFGLAVAAIEVQVRRAEEPHLLRVHGDAYASYAADVGRFVPRVGRLRRAPPDSG
jgi:protein-S-isoprenylcysteine O-methyltransferase Ste14